MKQVIYIALIFLSVNMIFSTKIIARPGGGNSFTYDSDDDDDAANSYDDNNSNYNFDNVSNTDDDDYWNDNNNDNNYSSSGGGSSKGNVFLIFAIFMFFVIAAALNFLKQYAKKKSRKIYANTKPISQPKIVNTSIKPSAVAKTPIKSGVKYLYEIDPNFSKIFFIDFVNLLIISYFKSIGKNTIRNIDPFISQKLHVYANNFAEKFGITNNNDVSVSELVIGALHIKSIQVFQKETAILVSADLNFSLKNKNLITRHIMTSDFTFRRNNSVQTKEPKGGVYELVCPNCGSSLNITDVNICSSCGQRIYSMQFIWCATNIKIKFHNVIKQDSLYYYADEKGTSKQTFTHYLLDKNLLEFIKKYNLSSIETFKTSFTQNVVKPVFLEMYKSWAELKWEKVRHLLSDRLWESNNFWIEAYKHYKVVNKLDKIFINEIEFSNLETDKFFESITVRIFASCIDYVQEIETGKLVAGDNKNFTVFSEYWTFVRRVGIDNSIDKVNVKVCPNCGAVADKIGQSAICEYCNTKISTGEFGWILSAITQDDVYRG